MKMFILEKHQKQKRVYSILFNPTHSTALQIPRALLASIIAASVDILGLILLVELSNFPPVVASIISYLVGGIVQYALCSLWVFPFAPKSVLTGYTAFTLLSLIGLIITVVVIWLVHDQLNINYLIAKCLALGLAFIWNFASRKYLIFTENNLNDIFKRSHD